MLAGCQQDAEFVQKGGQIPTGQHLEGEAGVNPRGEEQAVTALSVAGTSCDSHQHSGGWTTGPAKRCQESWA